MEPLCRVRLVCTLRVAMVGELFTPVSVLCAALTSCWISRSTRLPEWITGFTFRITPVLRYCTVCSTPVPSTLVALTVDCWLVMIGTSWPTWMVAVCPLRAMMRGLDRMRSMPLDSAAERRTVPHR